MQARWLWVWICLVLGLVLLGCGLLVPVHLRAVDASVVLSAGRSGDSLLERGKFLMDSGRLGAAQLEVSAARLAGMPGWDRLGQTLTNRMAQMPGALFWGNDSRIKAVFNSTPDGDSFAGFVIQRDNREVALAYLGKSVVPGVAELLRCRELTHTKLFPPSSSVSGQAFDAMLAECGWLLDGHHLTDGLAGEIARAAELANQGNSSLPLELVLMDLGSLGERLNWDQLRAMVADIPDAATLHQLAGEVSNAGDRLPLLFAAVQLSREPSAVAEYAAKFPQTGLHDISASLWYGADGVAELAKSGQRLYQSGALRWLAAREPFGSIYYSAAARSLQNPGPVLAVKWLCYLGAGFLFALALHFSRPPVSRVEPTLQVRGFHLLREFLFSLGFLLVVLLLSEPFLAQDSQAGGFSPRLHLPMAGDVVPAGIAGIKQTIMDQNPVWKNPTLVITLLVFFVLQALIYLSCLVKLAEIRRQPTSPRMKLKLLENEDHLFDAGLYLGFVGTILSLIFASLRLVEFSLMAAYSSTAFGIIFVVIFKIFHLRPARRKLLLEAELVDATAASAPKTASQPV